MKLNNNGGPKQPPPPPRSFKPMRSTETVLEMVSKMTIARIANLAGLPVQEAEAYRVVFFRFCEDNAPRFPKWRTELDAWVDFRIEQLKQRKKLAA